ncbi:hypothetical protein [Burkholderia anthina]|uniref:hypothetical protein n=1 Tax=Burkholderia anthina TaxID=179879 RepID=UPI00158A6CEA|nr:hypothetical protein [Burkholderia anthina]
MKASSMTNIGRAVAVTMALAGLLHAGIASAAGSAGTAAASAALPADDQGLSLIVTYQTTPANRSVLQHELAQSTARELAQWKHDGRLTQYNLLFNRYADSGNWDAMAVLTFATPDDLYRWRKVEASHAGALSAKALAVTTSIRTAPVDLRRSDATAAGAAPDSVYVAIPYKTEVSASDYRKYADAYVIPQFKGWMDEGVLAGYSIYMSQFPAAREWDVIAILQYKNETALSEREAVVSKVRERLKSNPEWKSVSDSKQRVRAEGQVVVADPVVAGR